MTSALSRRGTGHLYKKIYFGASQTWDVWNKLTASDVFALTEQAGFEGNCLKLFATFEQIDKKY